NSSRVRNAFRGSKRVWCKQVGHHNGWWEVGTTINLRARWRLLRFALKLDEAGNMFVSVYGTVRRLEGARHRNA
ncbi:hypothetical protein A2U01_0074644, partial [Trifolium medium]|nr:hypothetical protein [Trifolium medium]